MMAVNKMDDQKRKSGFNIPMSILHKKRNVPKQSKFKETKFATNSLAVTHATNPIPSSKSAVHIGIIIPANQPVAAAPQQLQSSNSQDYFLNQSARSRHPTLNRFNYNTNDLQNSVFRQELHRMNSNIIKIVKSKKKLQI